MPIKIYESDLTKVSSLSESVHPEDLIARETAEKWMLRIRDFFITPRSYQAEIGISEVGSDCRKCVARKLALRPRKPEGSWYPFIGTAVHAALEEGFTKAEFSAEYLLEERLNVHQYKGLNLSGSCDMAALVSNEVVVVNDWKVVGERALKEAAAGKIKNQYRIQAMLYGYGWVQKGYKVTHVALTFLPRDKDLNEAEVFILRYDESVALDALQELEVMIDMAESLGWDAVINKYPKASFCWDCKKYEQNDESGIESLI